MIRDYGTVHAVRGIDLGVARGKVFGFLGPDGADLARRLPRGE